LPEAAAADAELEAEPVAAPDELVELDELDEQAARPRPATRARAAAVPPVVTALIYVSFDGKF
jgi:hypothetical protein